MEDRYVKESSLRPEEVCRALQGQVRADGEREAHTFGVGFGAADAVVIFLGALVDARDEDEAERRYGRHGEL